LEETEHFSGYGQQKVAKIVQCGEKIEEDAIRKDGLKFLRPIGVGYDPFGLVLSSSTMGPTLSSQGDRRLFTATVAAQFFYACMSMRRVSRAGREAYQHADSMPFGVGRE
jgi:hypothetical protein